MKEKTIEHAKKVIKDLMEKTNKEVIKSYKIPSLLHLQSGEITGFAVCIQLGTKFDYTNTVFDDWMKQLCADEYLISVKRGQLWVKFKIRYDEEE